MRIAMLVVATAAVAAAISFGQAYAAKDEIKPLIHVPKTWEAAVAEAKALNLPIVVHNHGWY